MTGWQGGRQDDNEMHRGCESGSEPGKELFVVSACDFSPIEVLGLSLEEVEGREGD